MMEQTNFLLRLPLKHRKKNSGQSTVYSQRKKPNIGNKMDLLGTIAPDDHRGRVLIPLCFCILNLKKPAPRNASKNN